ncbi:hypothetical protein [Pelomonas cellulosilytica]|uniref:Lipoprotein n=1 Tax=Pelomonas cellulosilytica TaxID=2906762 RepID=A0ABS8XR98_9BURK|nr:hypothetical protein [Pelomonas sp. P8]MCE4554255.1 hypothetical protein [Pelomonas sp. P8]
MLPRCPRSLRKNDEVATARSIDDSQIKPMSGGQMVDVDTVSKRRRLLALLGLFLSGCLDKTGMRQTPPEDATQTGLLKDVPSFPTPVPLPSTFAALSLQSAGITRTAGDKLTLGAIDEALKPCLNRAQYGERRYFSFPGGYAMLTQFERIEKDCKPSVDRWYKGVDPNDFDGTFLTYLRIMFKGNSRRSRFMTFVVTDQDVFTAKEAPKFAEFAALFKNGVLGALPNVLAMRSATPGMRLFVLVYEFELPADAKSEEEGKLVPHADVQIHLLGASLSPPLKLA